MTISRFSLFVDEHSRAIACLLAASALALAVLHGLITPIFETPDEILHFGFVRHLAEGRGLPVQPPSVGRHQAGQEASQPPLYYALTAILTGWVDVGDYHMEDWLNPHRQLGNGLAYGNKNTAIHPPDEVFPYNGVPLAVHLGRLLGAALAAGTVLFTYEAGREVWLKSTTPALIAAALVAFLPSAIFLAGGISNDNLVQPLAVGALWLALRSLRHGIDLRGAAALGLIGGLAALAKLSGLTFLPLLALAAAFGGWRCSRQWWQMGGWVVVVATIVAGWWYARNLILYGDPTGLNMMLAEVWRRPTGFSLWNLLDEWRFFDITFWGLFGTDNATADGLLYQVSDIAALVAAIGLALGAVLWFTRRQWWQEDVLVWAFLVAWVGLVLAGFLRWTLMNEANHGRHLFTALAPLALLFVAGWRSLLPGRFSWAPATAFAVFLGIFALIAPWRYTMPAHAATPILARGERPGDGWTELGYRYGGLLELVAVRVTRSDYQPGEWLDFDLLWETVESTDRNYSIFLHVNRPDGTGVVQEDTYPGLGSRPTRYLRPGDTLAERHRLFIPPNSAGPSALHLTVGVYDLANWQRLNVTGRSGAPLSNAPLVATFTLRGSEPPLPRQSLNVDFADGIQLVGFEFAKEGDYVTGALWWRAVRRPTLDYTEFLHVIAPPSPVPLAQWDGRPLAGNYPSLLWLPGTLIREPVRLRLPSPAPADLRLLAGLYDLSSGRRLLTSQGADHVELGALDTTTGRFLRK